MIWQYNSLFNSLFLCASSSFHPQWLHIFRTHHSLDLVNVLSQIPDQSFITICLTNCALSGSEVLRRAAIIFPYGFALHSSSQLSSAFQSQHNDIAAVFRQIAEKLSLLHQLHVWICRIVASMTRIADRKGQHEEESSIAEGGICGIIRGSEISHPCLV